MGRRSSSETIVAVYQAFLDRPTWRQAELARHVGVKVDAVRGVLRDLEKRGMPLERETDEGNVYWRVPKSWFPGGVLLDSATAAEVVRDLLRLPRTRAVRGTISKLLAGLPTSYPVRRAEESRLTPEVSDQESAYLSLVEDSLDRRVSLRMQYYSTSSGGLSWRHVSVHRVSPTAPARFVGMCHRASELRWFRVDGIMSAELDRAESFRDAAQEEVSRFIQESTDGFHEATPAMEHVFLVRDPEAKWAGKNLLAPMTAERVAGGIRVTAVTAGALRVARFVVGLGTAARVESEELRGVVKELARGALEAAGDGAGPRKMARSGRSLNARSVSVIRKAR